MSYENTVVLNIGSRWVLTSYCPHRQIQVHLLHLKNHLADATMYLSQNITIIQFILYIRNFLICSRGWEQNKRNTAFNYCSYPPTWRRDMT